MMFYKTIFSALLALLILQCSGPKTFIEPPTLIDSLPKFEAGYYTAHRTIDRNIEEVRGNNFLGNGIYIYRDEYLIDSTYFIGFRGAFLPNHYIKSRLVDGKIEHYWVNADKDSDNGVIKIKKTNSEKLILTLTKGEEEQQVLLKYLFREPYEKPVETILIAHRGTCYQPPFNDEGIYPANTIPAFESALRTGYEGFELDVRVTKDKRFILSHDEDLGVISKIKNTVKTMNLDEMRGITVTGSTTIPEMQVFSANALIAATLPSLEEVLEKFIDDPRLKNITVDIKPDPEEDILLAAEYDFSGMSEENQKKILFLTRTEKVAKGLREIAPHSNIALEGSKGIEVFEEPDKYMPEAVNLPRLSHNAISLNARLMLTIFDDYDESIYQMGRVVKSAKHHNYKVVGWTVSDEDRMNKLREAEVFSDYILSDAPFYKFALQEMKYYEQKQLIKEN
jgi:glycerophosphoryl diester phosphodiesterase